MLLCNNGTPCNYPNTPNECPVCHYEDLSSILSGKPNGTCTGGVQYSIPPTFTYPGLNGTVSGTFCYDDSEQKMLWVHMAVVSQGQTHNVQITFANWQNGPQTAFPVPSGCACGIPAPFSRVRQRVLGLDNPFSLVNLFRSQSAKQ